MAEHSDKKNHPTSPTIITRPDYTDMVNEIRSTSGFIERLMAFDGERIVLEDYQRDFLACQNPRRAVNKSRRVGMSWVASIEALTHCTMRDGHTAVFISYNLKDAQQKIRDARHAYDSLPRELRKELVVDSKSELEFRSKSKRGKASRILSLPSKAARGFGGNIYLDELAHCEQDQDIYRGSTAAVVRSSKRKGFRKQFTLISTPLGPRGTFWDVVTQSTRPYEGYRRFEIPWWQCRALCTDVEDALVHATLISTEERVERYGTPQIQEQLADLGLDDFQQEFECCFVDEALSYFTYDLIMNCCTVSSIYNHPHQVPQSTGRLVAGYDVGRVKDRSVFVLFEQQGELHRCLMLTVMKNKTFREQQDYIESILAHLPITRLSIDATGIGMQLAEELHRNHSSILHRCTFSAKTKEQWATTFKRRLEQELVELPNDRELVRDLHSIRREITDSGNIRFVAPKNKRGHADRAWACMLACQDERQIYVRCVGTVTATVLPEETPEEIERRLRERRRQASPHYRSYDLGPYFFNRSSWD